MAVVSVRMLVVCRTPDSTAAANCKQFINLSAIYTLPACPAFAAPRVYCVVCLLRLVQVSEGCSYQQPLNRKNAHLMDKE
jgi:hypothetical protein